jgi:hypothetical protein
MRIKNLIKKAITFFLRFFLLKAVVKVIVDFAHSFDCSGRHENPAGLQVLGDPARR